MSSPIVRAATPADLAGLTALRLAWSNATEITPVERDAFAERLAQWMQRMGDSVVCRVGDADTEIVGMAWLVVFERVPNIDTPRRLTGDVQSLYVRPEHRGQGLGSELVRALCEEADARGIERVTVSSNDSARTIYRAAGFDIEAGLLERRRLQLLPGPPSVDHAQTDPGRSKS